MDTVAGYLWSGGVSNDVQDSGHIKVQIGGTGGSPLPPPALRAEKLFSIFYDIQNFLHENLFGIFYNIQKYPPEIHNFLHEKY